MRRLSVASRTALARFLGVVAGAAVAAATLLGGDSIVSAVLAGVPAAVSAVRLLERRLPSAPPEED